MPRGSAPDASEGRHAALVRVQPAPMMASVPPRRWAPYARRARSGLQGAIRSTRRGRNPGSHPGPSTTPTH